MLCLHKTSLIPRLLHEWSREPGTHCLRMLSYPRISGALETSGYYAAISLRPSLYNIIRCTRTIEDGGASEESGNEAKPVLMIFVM